MDEVKLLFFITPAYKLQEEISTKIQLFLITCCVFNRKNLFSFDIYEKKNIFTGFGILPLLI